MPGSYENAKIVSRYSVFIQLNSSSRPGFGNIWARFDTFKSLNVHAN